MKQRTRTAADLHKQNQLWDKPIALTVCDRKLWHCWTRSVRYLFTAFRVADIAATVYALWMEFHPVVLKFAGTWKVDNTCWANKAFKSCRSLLVHPIKTTSTAFRHIKRPTIKLEAATHIAEARVSHLRHVLCVYELLINIHKPRVHTVNTTWDQTRSTFSLGEN